MQLLRDIAQQASYQAMLPGQIARHYVEQSADQLAFEAAAHWAANARTLRAAKAQGGTWHSAGELEALARHAESVVREIALQSEIILQRRADAAEADRAMLRIMRGAVS